ncbi:MAG: PQQ-binding-like beta-propeller repeat protein [Polyangiaceae bacterium]
MSCGEESLTALDVVTGEVVWRVCDPLCFASSVTVERDALYAVAGGAPPSSGRATRGARIHHIDPWSGLPRWSVELPRGVRPVAPPLACDDAVVLATRAQHGTGVIGFDARSGAQLFERDACLGNAAALAVDGTVILNSEAGEFAALDARTGAVRYRHVFAAGVEGDRPRKLDPVLRSGALFVPQTRVHVVRPLDGAILGAVDTELVPDLVRVDEHCNVIVAEESGHMAAFGAGAKLSLVR